MSPNAAPCALLTLRQTTRALTQLYDELLRPSGLKGTQYSALRVIQAKEPVSINELSDIMVMDRTTATRNLGLLVRDGLIRIEPGKDRRTRLASLTPSGRRALSRATRYWERAQRRVVARLGEKRYRRLRNELAELAGLENS